MNVLTIITKFENPLIINLPGECLIDHIIDVYKKKNFNF